MRNDPTTATAGIELSELTAILAEVRRAILAVDAGTGEHPPLRTLTLTLAPPGETDAADAAVGG